MIKDLKLIMSRFAPKPISAAECKGIVEAHDGTIEALSEGLGHGTTIRIRLPIKQPDDDEMAEM